MKHRTHGARLLGLVVAAALGAMAFAASAQAVNPGFLIAKKAALAATFSGEIVSGTISTMLVPGLNFQLSCTGATADEGVINTSTDAKATFLYTGCTTLDLTTKAEIECEVVEPIKSEALILPAELTDGSPAVLFEKLKALIRLTKKGDLTKPCILPEDNTATGEICYKIIPATNDMTVVLVEASATCKNRSTLEGLNNEVTSGGVPDLEKYGGQDALFDNQFKLALTGAHKGLTLGVSLF